MYKYYCVVSKLVNDIGFQQTVKYYNNYCNNDLLQQNCHFILPINNNNRYFCSTSSDDSKDNKKGPTDQSDVNKKKHNPKEDKFFSSDAAYGKKENKGQGAPERPFFDPLSDELAVVTTTEDEVLAPPTNCCRSGCPNCVWIEYVEALSKRYLDPKLSREKVLKDLESMEDESIKAFIKLELRSRGLL